MRLLSVLQCLTCDDTIFPSPREEGQGRLPVKGRGGQPLLFNEKVMYRNMTSLISAERHP